MNAHASLAVLDSLAVEVITDNVSDTYVSKTYLDRKSTRLNSSH